MLTSTRRLVTHRRFAGRNRMAIAAANALEQAGGLLLNPVALVAICSLLTTDLTTIVLPAVIVSLGWILGYRFAPPLLERSRRTLPWSIGASIVRAASLALLAYVIGVDGASGDQRLRSIMICVAAYALASGLVRGAAESLAPTATTSRRRRRSDVLVSLLPAAFAVVVGLSAFTLLIDVPRAPLTRLSTLYVVAAALAAAAVLALAWVVEIPSLAPLARDATLRVAEGRGPLLAVGWMLLAAGAGAAELFVLVGLFRDMELPRAYVLSGIGAVLVASALASAAFGQLLPALRPRALMQVSAVVSSIAFVVAIGLPTLVDAEQSPDRLVGRRPVEIGIWVALVLIGVAQQARRRILPDLIEQTGASPNLVNGAGLVLAFAPLVIAAIFERWSVQSWLVAGLALALLGIALGGVVSSRRDLPRAGRGTVRQAARSRAVGSVGSRSVP